MMKKTYMFILFWLAIEVAFYSIGFAAPAQPTIFPRSLGIGTSPVGGAYHIVGSALAKVLEKEMAIPVTASVTQGANENVRLLRKGDIAIGTVAGQVLYTAYNGLGGWERNHDLRALMTLYRNTSLHIALRGSGLVRLTDLKGKRVGMSLDRAQSGPGVGQMMRGHGFAYEGDKWEPKFTEFKEVFAGFEQLHTMIGDHLLDATNTIITAGRPLPALSNLMSKQKLVVLRYDGAVIKRLEAELPYLKGVELRAGEVPGLLDEDTLGYDIGGAGTLTVLAGMDEQLAYQIVRIIHKNLDRLAKDCIFFRPAQHNPALFLQDYGIPFHPGAIRYWKEAGLWK